MTTKKHIQISKKCCLECCLHAGIPIDLERVTEIINEYDKDKFCLICSNNLLEVAQAFLTHFRKTQKLNS
jgi:hypothetical protein